MQQAVDAGQTVLHPELLLEDPNRVAATQRGGAGVLGVGLGWAGEEPLAEGLLLLDRQLRGLASARAGLERLKPTVAVAIAPGLYGAAASADPAGDHKGFVPVEGQEHSPVAIP